MRNRTLAAASPLGADRYLRDPNHRARFSELLDPEETAAQLAASYPDIQHQGWTIRVELTPEEVELLEGQGHERRLRVDIVHFSPGLPVAVLRTLAKGVEFRFGVPLWQPGAQDWLFDAVDGERLLVLLDLTDGNSGIALHGCGNLQVDRVSLISAAALAQQLDGEESTYQMLIAGLRLLRDNALQPSPAAPTHMAVRVALAGRGERAMAVVRHLMANEMAMRVAC